MWKYLLPVAAFLVLAAVFALGLNPSRDIHALPSPLIGKPAPVFNLTDVIDPNRMVTNSTFKGQVYVVNVWATWCQPCRQEQDALMDIASRNAVPIIGIDYRDQRAKAQQWLQQLGNPYVAVAFDGDGRTAIDWGVYGAPETYLIDADGNIVFKYISPMTADVWEREFMPRIEAARQSAPRSNGA